MDLDPSRGLAKQRGPGAMASPYILGQEVAAAASGKATVASHYTPRAFFRQVPNALLKLYFDRRKELAGFDWATLDEEEVDPLYEEWLELPEQNREEAESEFRMVWSMARPDAIRVIVEEGTFAHQYFKNKPDFVKELDTIEGLEEKAFWVFLHHRRVFDVASQFQHADSLGLRYWRKRTGMPKKSPRVTKVAREELGNALRAFYREREGRGEQCRVECYLRGGKDHYYFAYPADYAGTFIGYKPDGTFDRRPQKPAFEVVFVYNEEDGTLDLNAHGDKELAHDLQEIFSRVILGEDLGPESPSSTPYDLSKLKTPGFRFPTDPADRISEVRVKALRLQVLGSSRRLILDVGAMRKRDSIYDFIANSLDPQKLPMTNVDVTLATIQMAFRNGTKKDKIVTFNVSAPDSCNLRDTPEHLVAKKHLKLWEIARV